MTPKYVAFCAAGTRADFSPGVAKRLSNELRRVGKVAGSSDLGRVLPAATGSAQAPQVIPIRSEFLCGGIKRAGLDFRGFLPDRANGSRLDGTGDGGRPGVRGRRDRIRPRSISIKESRALAANQSGYLFLLSPSRLPPASRVHKLQGLFRGRYTENQRSQNNR